MRCLLIEKDDAVASVIEDALSQARIFVHRETLGEEGLQEIAYSAYDLVVVGISPVDMTAEEVVRKLRLNKRTEKIMVISQTEDTDEAVRFLSLGADDYRSYPFPVAEFVARVQVQIRRAYGHTESIIQVGPLSLNLEAKLVTVEGSPVHMTAREYKILELLVLRKGSVLHKDTFLNHVYGGRDEPEAKIIDVFICKIRKKLAEKGLSMDCIKTVWGQGYTLGNVEMSREMRAA